MTALYDGGEVDAVYIVFNEFKSVLAQNLTLQKLLPFEPDPALAGEGAELADGATPVDYLYEQPAAELFARLLPRPATTVVVPPPAYVIMNAKGASSDVALFGDKTGDVMVTRSAASVQ